MRRPFRGVEQISHVVEAQPGSERPEITRVDRERWQGCAARAPLREGDSQGLVHDFLERLAGSPHLSHQQTGDVRIECQRRVHIMRLRSRPHGVNPSFRPARRLASLLHKNARRSTALRISV